MCQLSCTPKDQFSPVKDILIESDELMKGSSYCLSENMIPSMKRVKTYLQKKEDSDLIIYFRKKGVTEKKMMAEVIVRSLCDTRSIYPNQSIKKMENKHLEPIVEQSCQATIRRSKNIFDYYTP
jgi:hypothetical protein